MRDIIFYGHGGSRNHGCEAIVLSTKDMLNENVSVYTTDIEGDLKYSLDEFVKLVPMHNTKESKVHHIYAAIARRLLGDYGPLIAYQYKDLSRLNDKIMVSVGGDNYCNQHPLSYVAANKLLSKNNKTVLWGCSITPELLEKKVYVDDMNRYSLITARESYTYEALINAGVTSKVVLCPDPAFTLEKEEVTLPEGFELDNTIGINLSPLVEGESGNNNLAYKGTEELIEYIINETNYKIALIPHVVWDKSDDLKSLLPLYEKFKTSGRVVIVDKQKELNGKQLKYIISKLKMLVAARTHASIAAYSTCIPTLVLGYSIKSKGIARDLFGTYENYVVPVQDIKNSIEIVNSFKWLDKNYKSIKKHLVEYMPEYKQKGLDSINYLLELK